MNKNNTVSEYDINSPQLMELFQLGDEKAFSIVFNHFYNYLCFFSYQLINDRDGAEDLAKEALIKLWLRRTDFQELHKIKAFLSITVRNASLNFIRHMKVRSKTAKEMIYVCKDFDEPKVLSSLIKSEIIQLIFAEIEKLPRKRRAIFKLAFLEERTNEEIANLLNISISTVKTQKARSMLAIRILARNWVLLIALPQILQVMLHIVTNERSIII